MGMAKSLPLSGLPMATPPCGWRALAVMVESVSAFAFAPPPPPPPRPRPRDYGQLGTGGSVSQRMGHPDLRFDTIRQVLVCSPPPSTQPPATGGS